MNNKAVRRAITYVSGFVIALVLISVLVLDAGSSSSSGNNNSNTNRHISSNVLAPFGGVGGDRSIRNLAHNNDINNNANSLSRFAGKPIMSKMTNDTIKAELGRSSWRLLHTIANKFPYEPTRDEKQALLDFIYLFARLYPCGDWYKQGGR